MNRIRLKGTYALIKLDNIVHNYRQACGLTGDRVSISCVVKSDAYGHGEKQVVKALLEEGLKTICVATIFEGIRLRQNFPNIEILILGYTPKHLVDQVSHYRLIQAISTIEEAYNLNQQGPSLVHLMINTGMNRLGFTVDQIDFIKQVYQFANIKVCGIFTHLHSGDHMDKTSSLNQYNKYLDLIEKLELAGLNPGRKHVCNSAGIIDLEDMHEDMVRQGIMLYGLYPSDFVSRDKVDLMEAMELHSYIASIRTIKKGQGVSYGHTYMAEKDTKLAVVNMGYSDGVFRLLSNQGQVIISGQKRPIIGNICMNMFMVDITGMDHVCVEDEVILFGGDDKSYISIDEVARKTGTISYEVVCRTGYSVPRVYLKNNKIIEVEEDLLIERRIDVS